MQNIPAEDDYVPVTTETNAQANLDCTDLAHADSRVPGVDVDHA